MNKEERGLRAYAICFIFSVLVVALGFMGIKLKDLQARLTDLERGTSEAITDQQGQIDSLDNNIIQHNTNQALSRLRKQKEELEKKLEEGLELRRQRLAEMQARWSAPSTGWSDAGGFLLTAYEWTGKTCANGNYPTVGYTCASNYYPLGTRLWIEGIGERVVEDTGGMGMNVVDIYMGDEETCIQFGVQEAQITVIEE